ncbi:MAG: pyridoxal-phosphate dependent enzyme [Bacteroidales bacterium]|nr:pyridoxal-phosphate dependent enzyme [Bacteroidales bacterium]MCF8405033.1 pyridoxal-phosphate dependent enzyme [Bacteroidales bacterium]
MNTLPNGEKILEAAKRISEYIHHTPVLSSNNLDELTNSKLFFKCENLQKAGAFKSRGAVNAVFSLSYKEIENGVCTHSSGNHAAALARAASLRKIKAHIVMPENSSKVKIAAVKHYGGIITFCKPTLDSREQTLEYVRRKTNALEIHPYNNYKIIAGQATAALELINTIKDLNIIMAPVGGGGLLSGTALSTSYFSPGTKVIAAEPKGADDAYRSFVSKSFVPSLKPNTVADGLLTSLGSLTFPIIIDNVHSILTVKEESIIKAMKLTWERMKIIIEPSSAVPLAAVLENHDLFATKRVGIIISGGNVDLDALPWFQKK